MLQECQGFGWRDLPGRQAGFGRSQRTKQECQGFGWRELRAAGALVEPPVSPQTCQGFGWRELRPRGGAAPWPGPGFDRANRKKTGAVKGRAAAKRSDVYPLLRILFCETGSG